ncbi:hypothetical protein CTA2_10428 [Colletotrichum tanaceti]|uniref:2EXR domain-containing protein n=1 Tax=Colletotrichum tanaceti TaxID=1306861 RepID=A0A4U6XG21_9PEZI|nr:hypothetical protein CTA2_10428 [Colletotrichum tanaceti]TKW54828.1 hypothetical protein CTA1_3958 [Colletotrichum tanaceti]
METFHFFLRLPFELRIRIWQLTREPRHVTIRARAELNKYRRHPLDYTLLYCGSSTPTPAVVQACRESRNLGLYQRSFAGGARPRYTWIDFESDTIQATYWDLKLVTREKETIRHLAIEVEDVECLSRHYQEALTGFRVLETVDFLSDESLREWAHVIEQIRDTMQGFVKQSSSKLPSITIVEKATHRTMSLVHCEQPI